MNVEVECILHFNVKRGRIKAHLMLKHLHFNLFVAHPAFKD